MEVTTVEKVRVLCRRLGITSAILAERMGCSRQNLANKMRRDNFSTRELQQVAAALGAELEISFVFPDGSRF